MARPRPPAALRQWLHLRESLSKPCPNTGLPYYGGSSTPTNPNRQTNHARHFHPSPPSKAQRPAPRAARAQKEKNNKAQLYEDLARSGQVDFLVDRNGIFMGTLNTWGDGKDKDKKTLEERLVDFDKICSYQYQAGIRDGFIPSGITENTFRDVGIKLLKAAFTAPPNGQSIRAISTDVDAVYRLGFMASIDYPPFRGWIVGACALAKASLAVVTIAHRQITKDFAPSANTNTWIRENEKLAEEGYPPAMLLHAKILGIQGHLEAALEVLKKILPNLYPAGQKPMTFEDITLSGALDSPYRLQAVTLGALAQMYDSQEYRDASDKALATAAMEYNDKEALFEYAGLMMTESKLDLYEECMSKAATAGSGKACLLLANYYYLTSMGRYPTYGERKAANFDAKTWKPIPASQAKQTEPAKGSWALLKNMFGRSMTRPEYLDLARDWYRLAYEHGETRAAFMCALLVRELGFLDHGRMYLEQSDMENEPLYKKKLEELKKNWYDKSYEPSVPLKMLPVQ